jgi:hypothetical protein
MVAATASFPELNRTMAKGNGARKATHSSAFRREWIGVADLRQSARQLTEQAAALDELANIIEGEGIKRVHVDGARKFPNALKLLRVYQGNVRKAFIDEQNKG